ncbi:MAG: acyl carrier protein [Alphaproteobacteria bacterium]|nr:acyl carrier protein [Alphaproteobacteria bacterium]MCB9697197.1 acyl carrier protein [Alphaproteobacteria bacterium]
MTHDELQDQVVRRVARTLGKPPDAIDPQADLERFGLDSVEAVALAGELEQLLGRPVEATTLWDHRCIADLCAALCNDESTDLDDELRRRLEAT